MTGRKRILFLSVAAITLCSVLIFMFREQILSAIGDYLMLNDELKPADVIHVIAGDDNRTYYAIELYKEGYGKYIFFTGGWCKIHGWEHGAHGKELAINQGISEHAIAYDDETVTSTYAEALKLKAWINTSKIPITSIMVVSAPFHMRRVDWTYRFIFGDEINIILAPIPLELTPYHQKWWTDERSMMFVRDEYIKLLYYFLRYKLSINWLANFDKE